MPARVNSHLADERLWGGPVSHQGMSDWDHGVMGDAEPTVQGMTASEVHAIVDWLETRAVVYQINGGWAVDGLVGHQTRPHRDLDLFVDAAAVDDIVGWLTARGYAVETDWLPARLELRSGPLRVDVHPMVLDSDGNGVQRGLGGEVFEHSRAMRTLGVVSGRAVVVATAKRLRELHEGYESRDVDVHDLHLLAEL